jgi:signal transduction histidine kinase/CheY-like chemotaxis protein
MGRVVVQKVLVVWSIIWVLYGVSALIAGPIRPDVQGVAGMLLRFNSLIDVGLQVTLATSLIVVVMSEAQRTKVEALRERDRLREQVQRDEKFRALSAVVGGVAHEINNPLTAILGYSEDLAAADAATREQAATVVREQAERCLVIVQRMSLLGRGAAVVAGAIDVGELVRRIARELEPRLQAAGVTLQLELARLSRAFVADPTGVEQVLVNLLGNALHASPRGQVVTLVVAEYAEGVRFEVIDHGGGVPAADRTRIFEPFWTTKKVGDGSGLGLAVVDTIVRSHGGRIEVGTVRGGGAHFTVYWPHRPATAAAAVAPFVLPVPAAPAPPTPPSPTSTPASPQASAAMPSLGGSRLLVIDDEPLVRRTIVRQAQAEGWTVTEADSGERGLELLLHPAAAFDAVVCDVRMPGMSGVGVHDALAQRAPAWLRRLVFITGDMASTDAAQFASRCAAPIVEKPFLAADLMRRVRAVGHSA